MRRVVDSSAVIAVLFQESGASKVAPELEGALISSVNALEVLRVLTRRGTRLTEAKKAFDLLWTLVIPFDYDDVPITAEIAEMAPHLSLGDCACIALARRQSANEILTADRAWKRTDFGIPITLIR